MKIAIEAQRIFRKEKHGMDYVALETIRELQKIDQQNEYFILVSPGDDVCLQESANMHIVTVNWPSYPLWEQIGLPLALKKIKPDLLHCTSNTAPVHGNIPLVLTLHDIIFLEKKQGKNQSMYQRLGRFYRKIIVPQILTKCKRIITVSHFECNRISHFLHIDKQLLVAVYNGYSQHFIPIRNAQAITARYIKNHPYLFFLGNTDPKKNTARVLQAYFTRKFRHPHSGGDGLWNSRHHLNHFRHARNRRTGGYSGQSVRTGGNCFRPPSFRRKCRILSVTNCIWTRKSPSVLMGEHSQRNIEYI